LFCRFAELSSKPFQMKATSRLDPASTPFTSIVWLSSTVIFALSVKLHSTSSSSSSTGTILSSAYGRVKIKSLSLRAARIAWIVTVSVIGGIFLLILLTFLVMLCACPEKFNSPPRRYRSPYDMYNYPRPPPYPQYPPRPAHYPPLQNPPPAQNPYASQYPSATGPGLQPVNQTVPPPIPPPQVQQAASNILSYPAVGSQLYEPPSTTPAR
jgi:hypothetical protein